MIPRPDHPPPAGRVSSGPTGPRPSIVTASLDELLGGCSPCRRPAPVDSGHDAGGRPVACAESRERLAATATRVRARPVVRRRQPTVACAPAQHGVEHALPSPPALDRARVARLAIGVGVPLPVPRLGVGAAAATHADITRLVRPRLLAGRIVEIRLDRRRRATKTIRDLPDGEPLELAVVSRQRDGPATLENPTRSRG